MAKEKVSELTEAALAYDQELRRFEELAAAARRTKLNSERNLTRAAEALQKAGESQQRLLQHVQKIVAAMQAGRADQEREANALVQLGQSINARRTRYGELFSRMAELGDQAAEIQKVLSSSPDKEQIDALSTRMEAAAERAGSVATDARAEEMEDLERQADSMRQQLLSARNKLQLLGKKL